MRTPPAPYLTHPCHPIPPHTAVQALTTTDTSHQAEVMQRLLKMQCGNGLMHESIDASLHNTDDGSGCTRPDFEWANSMLVALVEETLGLDCDAEAQRLHLNMIREREKSERASAVAVAGGQVGVLQPAGEGSCTSSVIECCCSNHCSCRALAWCHPLTPSLMPCWGLILLLLHGLLDGPRALPMATDKLGSFKNIL